MVKLSSRDIFTSLGIGVFGFFLYQILSFSALARIPASMNAVLVSSSVVFIALLALFSGAVMLATLTAITVGFTEIIIAGWSNFLLMVFLGLTMIGIAYPLWFICLKRLPASHASIYIYLTPVFAVVLSLIILHERFSWLFWVGGVFILAGIIITNKFASGRSSNY
ncbi:MAG TPA: hypothetical protein DCP02_00400 [Actinobacteria bacterium]|nr:hypothetical protein [Actinomycetota bacterium]